MTEADASAPEAPKGKLVKLVMPLLLIALAGTGFGVTYFLDLVPAGNSKPKVEVVHTSAVFVDVPQVKIPIPEARGQTISVTATIETEAAHQSEVEHLLPRVQDVFTSFLSNVDADAYEKRGALEIIRAELLSRTRMVLGEEQLKDLLITEFFIE